VRRDLLLELGEARLRASQPRCLETFGAAAELARATRDADALGEAVLGLAGRATALATDATHAELLEEALSALGPADSELRVRVLARLAQAVAPARALVLSEEALAMAERLDSDTARLAALAGRHSALLASPAQRAPVGRAWVELADRTGELEAAALARHWHVLDLVQAGDRPGADRELVLLSELAERLQQPLYRYCALVWQTLFARIDGDDAQVAASTARALAVAEQMRLPDAAHRFAGEIDALTVATA
jgi:hypothetical protein